MAKKKSATPASETKATEPEKRKLICTVEEMREEARTLSRYADEFRRIADFMSDNRFKSIDVVGKKMLVRAKRHIRNFLINAVKEQLFANIETEEDRRSKPITFLDSKLNPKDQ